MASPQPIAEWFAGMDEADRAFVELMVGVHDRLKAIALAYEPHSKKGFAIEAARRAMIRLTAGALKPD